MGVIPDFNKIDEDNAREMLTTGAEVLRMIRDGDADSTDERAREIYGKLFTDN